MHVHDLFSYLESMPLSNLLQIIQQQQSSLKTPPPSTARWRTHRAVEVVAPLPGATAGHGTRAT